MTTSTTFLFGVVGKSAIRLNVSRSRGVGIGNVFPEFIWQSHILDSYAATNDVVSMVSSLDPDKVIAEMAAMVTDETRRENMREQTNIFRVLVKTLLNAGIITDRTRAFYAVYVDLDELKNEGDRMVGDDIAEQGIAYLQEINFKDRALGAIKIAAE